MKTDDPKTILLSDYQASEWCVDSLHLDFSLNEDATTLVATANYRNTALSPSSSLFLHGRSLELLKVEVDGQKVTDYQQEDEGLTLNHLPVTCEVRITTRLYPQKNTSLEGLYQSSGNYCTQCEAQGFRKITYFQDRPDVMTVYTTRIEADQAQYPVLLSNGNLVDSGCLSDGRHFALWNDPHRKPAYLFALVAGDLSHVEDHFTTQSGRDVVLKIYTEAHNIQYCEHAMHSLKRAMAWDEERFGLEYDLDIYMIVAVDDFNMGAMENKGLNIFNSRLVFASPDTATDKQYIAIEAVIGHEYFHNWTGNRVTCRDWFQLSLKEGLTVFRDQEFTADLHSRAVKRIEDVRFLRSMQFNEDAGPMAHPIRPVSYIEINNFYTLTVYEKGAEVVRLYHTLLGQSGFRKGMDLYFERHDGQAVTTEDFLAAMGDANDVDLSALQPWYDQAGTPELTVTMDYSSKDESCTLHFTQSSPAVLDGLASKPYLIPVNMGLVGVEGDYPLILAQSSQAEGVATETGALLLTLTERETSVTFSNIKAKPVPSLLRNFSAPIKLHYDYSDDDYIFLMFHDSDAFNRWEACQQLAMNTMLAYLEADAVGQGFGLSHAFIEAYQHILNDDELDEALRAEALQLPSYAVLAEKVGQNIKPNKIVEAVDFVTNTLANTLQIDFDRHYNALNQDSYVLDGKGMARRQLKAVCLTYLAKTDDESIAPMLMRQFNHADNMTDRLSALRHIVNQNNADSQIVLDQFYQQWKDNTQVLDQWFSIQASAQCDDVLARVKQLITHPKFIMNNPNKVRSLVGTFSNNYAAFHDEKGEGYTFLADIVKQLDAINPQIAARLVKPLVNWRQLEAQRSLLMKNTLYTLQADSLSKDLYEVVNKALLSS